MTDDDRLSGLYAVWKAADITVAASFIGGLALGFVGVIPFGVGFAITFLSGAIAIVLSPTQSHWMLREFERLARRPTWAAASGGATQMAHAGELSVFRGEGRLLAHSRGRRTAIVIGFDESAFVALAHGPGLSRVRRRVLLTGQPVDFDVQVVRGDCILEERLSGLRLRLVPDRGLPASALGYLGLEAGSPEHAERLIGALAAAGWRWRIGRRPRSRSRVPPS